MIPPIIVSRIWIAGLCLSVVERKFCMESPSTQSSTRTERPQSLNSGRGNKTVSSELKFCRNLTRLAASVLRSSWASSRVWNSVTAASRLSQARLGKRLVRLEATNLIRARSSCVLRTIPGCRTFTATWSHRSIHYSPSEENLPLNPHINPVQFKFSIEPSL